MIYVHDYRIISYEVDYLKKQVSINVLSEENYFENEINKQEVIKFEEVLFYNFKYDEEISIILDLEEDNIDKFIDEHFEYIKKNIPINNLNKNDLKNKLINEKYKYYSLSASLGMIGYILAKNCLLLK